MSMLLYWMLSDYLSFHMSLDAIELPDAPCNAP
mgnify:CR=1 FL=1